MNYNADDFNDRYFNATLKTIACGTPNYSATGKNYDSRCHSVRGIKAMQFIPMIDRTTFYDDDRTNSDRYVKNAGRPLNDYECRRNSYYLKFLPGEEY